VGRDERALRAGAGRSAVRLCALSGARLALADPEEEFEKDVWDLRVFGKEQAYRMDFTAISQPWLKALAKQWAREKAPSVHPNGLTHMLYAVNELSRALARARTTAWIPQHWAARTSARCWSGSASFSQAPG
jgi:hypothetical protein